MPSPIRSSQSIDASFDLLITNLEKSFPNADICECLALNRLRHARARQHELAEITPEIHPAASADPEIRRAHRAADRDFWRALTYLQRRLDHRAHLAERQANPTPAYAATLFQPDHQPSPALQPPLEMSIAPANSQLAPAPRAAASAPTRTPAIDRLNLDHLAATSALNITIAPQNKALVATRPSRV